MTDFPQGPEKTKAAAPRQENAASENTQPQNHTTPVAGRNPDRIIKNRSTSTKSQCDRALELLKSSPQTTYSLRKKGISHPAQRLKELMRDGYPISSSRVNAVDSDGYTHVNVALYSLELPPQSEFATEVPS